MKKKATRHPARFKKIRSAFGKIGTLNIVLIFVGAYMIFINWQMLKVFQICGSAPETAWCALIAALLGECGICGWIKTTKEKHGKERKETEVTGSCLDAEGQEGGEINPEQDLSEDAGHPVG